MEPDARSDAIIVKRSIPINVPNTLTLLRILLTPLFAIFLIKHFLDLALLVFAIAAVSDGMDGLIARLFRQKTTLGAYLDPAADKLLLTTAFVTLRFRNWFRAGCLSLLSPGMF